MTTSAVDRALATLDETTQWQETAYKDFHSHPELSMQETRTAAEIEKRLTAFGYRVIRVGGGVVGVLDNGDGPTLMARADFDALPVSEQTGLPYASTVTTTHGGETVGVMHACGHDVHITTLLGAAELMARTRDVWHGTYLPLFQPGEETGEGAKSMVDAGLTSLVPRPVAVLGQHVMGMETGKVFTGPGAVLSAADSIRIILHGTGAHGSMPQLGVDPIVLASAIVLRLQAIVSREIAPGERAVVTVGSITAGTGANIIPDTATLLLNVRTFSDETRKTVLDAIKRIVIAECHASNTPKPPEFEFFGHFPMTTNDVATTEKVTEAFNAHFGAARVGVFEFSPASEDFSELADAFGVPYTYWALGGFPPGVTAPANHSPFFAPVIEPTLRTGTEAMVTAALAYLGK